MTRQKILIIDDDLALCELLEDFLTEKGYRVITANGGNAGFQKAKDEEPQLIVLDVDMPDITGYEVCKKIRDVSYLQHTPIIMLTGRRGQKSELNGFQSGADDYITKPFKAKGLLARIETAIGRSTRQLEANALTHLPGNQAIFNEIEERIRDGRKFSVIYMDLNNFKAFNDRYGFIKGDEAIRLTADLMTESVEASGLPDAFLGHVGGDDFVAIVGSFDIEPLCEEIIRKFDAQIINLYEAQDREAGRIITTDRKGARAEFPIMGLAIAVVTNKLKPFSHPGEVALLAGDLKRVVKAKAESSFVVDRRS